MRIGIISDIHGILPKSAAEALVGCDAILCAGDIIGESTLESLEAIAPTVAIRGNVDDNHRTYQELPTRAEGELGGVRYFMAHKPKDAKTVPAGTRLVVFGHTHKRLDEERDGVRYVNPGAIRRVHEECGPGLAILTIENRGIEGLEFVNLRA